MGLGFRSEVQYDAVKDRTSLTSDSPDFSTPLNIPLTRGSAEDLAVRALLEDQGVVDFSAHLGVKMDGLDEAGLFGVHADGSQSALNLVENPHVFLFGKEGSGVANFIRNYLLWAARESAYIVAVNLPDNLYGTKDYVESEAGVQHVPLPQYVDDFEDMIDSNALGGVPAVVITNLPADFSTLSESTQEAYFNLVKGKFGDNVYSLTVSDAFLQADAFDPDGLWVEEYRYLEEILDYTTSGFIGDVTPVTAVSVTGDESVPYRNARGVAWFSLPAPTHPAGTYQRVNTYVVPRTAWQELTV